MTTDQYSKNIFLGVFPKDLFPDRSQVKYPSCFVINTDDSNGPGEHWIAIYLDSDYSCYFFDSLGYSPVFYGFDWNLVQLSRKIFWNKIKYQPLNSTSCGYYSIIYLLFKCRNIDIENTNLSEKTLIDIFKDFKK